MNATAMSGVQGRAPWHRFSFVLVYLLCWEFRVWSSRHAIDLCTGDITTPAYSLA